MTLDICKKIQEAYLKPTVFNTRGRSGVYPNQASVRVKNEVLGGCNRQAFFRWFGYEEQGTVVPDWDLSSHMGDWMHVGFVNMLRQMTVQTGLVVLSEEQSFYDLKHLISGRTDIFLMDSVTGEITGVDIKTVGEYAGKQCYYQPKVEHILQCAVYLYEYQETAKLGKRSINDWLILYISRDENWDLKKYIHGSCFKYMWQFALSFDKPGDIDSPVCIQNQAGVVTRYPEITMKGILDRYEEFLDHVKSKTLPDRDFSAQYTEDKIAALHLAGKLKFKKDIAIYDKWIKKGAEEGKLGIEMGDDACYFCRYKTQCYSSDPLSFPKKERILYDLQPINKNKKTKLTVF